MSTSSNPNNCNTCPPSPIAPWQRPTVSPITDTLVGAGAISLATVTTYLNQTAPADEEDPTVAYGVTLADGNYKQQRKIIQVPAPAVPGTALFRVTGNFVGFVSLLFDDYGQSVELIWDGYGWHKVAGNATAEDQ
jgi:hypothetical protein